MTLRQQLRPLAKVPMSKALPQWRKLVDEFGLEAVVGAVMELQREMKGVRG